MDFWKTIEDEVFKNEDLDVYEKMCFLVLMSREEEIKLTSEELGRLMGCGKITAKRAFDSLRVKGYLEKDYRSDPPKPRESKVIRPEEDVDEIVKVVDTFQEDFQEGFFTTERMAEADQEQSPVDERRKLMAAYILGDDSVQEDSTQIFRSQKEKKAGLVDQVIELIEEKISFKEANIILAFAGNDIDKISKTYQMAKASQVTDTISYLINALQKKDSHVIKASESKSEKTQIDATRLMKMQAYNNMKPKK